jgi:hypothetical protein
MDNSNATSQLRNIFQQMQHNSTYNQEETDHLVNGIMNDNASQWGGSQSDGLDTALLEDFKGKVKRWMELDTEVKRLQHAITERRRAQNILSEKIVGFMKQHNIEDLNTRDGILRYKTRVVKSSLTQKTIKERLAIAFNNDSKAMEAVQKVFEQRDSVEKPSLRRVNI